MHHPQLRDTLVNAIHSIDASTHSNMVVLPTGCESVTLCYEVLVVHWTRLLERHWLEVACRNGLAVVPADLNCPYTHCGRI